MAAPAIGTEIIRKRNVWLAALVLAIVVAYVIIQVFRTKRT